MARTREYTGKRQRLEYKVHCKQYGATTRIFGTLLRVIIMSFMYCKNILSVQRERYTTLNGPWKKNASGRR